MSTLDYRVYLVTDEPSVYQSDFVASIECAIQGGVTIVQYRDTQSTEREAYARVLRLQDMLRLYHVPLVINNHVGLALAVGADAVHVGQSDMPVEAVRAVVGSRMEIGLSITNFDQVKNTNWSCVDVVGIGPVWDARKTKADAEQPMGVSGFAEIANAVLVPKVAIGGITLENASQVVKAGADGLAVVSAFSRSDDSKRVAQQFRNLFE